MTPRAFVPRHVEAQTLADYKTFTSQMQAYASDARAREHATELVALYNRKPWLTPGIATAYAKWKTDLGRSAARGLARTAVNAPDIAADPSASTGPASFARSGVGDALEEYIGTKDFQRQVKAFRESLAPRLRPTSTRLSAPRPENSPVSAPPSRAYPARS
jgi:hypothetical protein